MKRSILVVGLMAVGLASSMTFAHAQAPNAPARTTANPPAASATKTVGSLAAGGFIVRGNMPKPSDPKQVIVIMQKDAEVYFCSTWLDKLGVAADTCYKGL
jgi:murein endopeptidase